jgi:hypothetical protein
LPGFGFDLLADLSDAPRRLRRQSQIFLKE